MRTEGKELIMFASDFHSQPFPEVFAVFVPLPTLPPFSLLDSISEFPRENIVWKRR